MNRTNFILNWLAISGTSLNHFVSLFLENFRRRYVSSCYHYLHWFKFVYSGMSSYIDNLRLSIVSTACNFNSFI